MEWIWINLQCSGPVKAELRHGVGLSSTANRHSAAAKMKWWSWRGTHSYGVSGDVPGLALQQSVGQLLAVVRLSVRHHDHHLCGALPRPSLGAEGFGAAYGENRGLIQKKGDTIFLAIKFCHILHQLNGRFAAPPGVRALATWGQYKTERRICSTLGLSSSQWIKNIWRWELLHCRLKSELHDCFT